MLWWLEKPQKFQLKLITKHNRMSSMKTNQYASIFPKMALIYFQQPLYHLTAIWVLRAAVAYHQDVDQCQQMSVFKPPFPSKPDSVQE